MDVRVFSTLIKSNWEEGLAGANAAELKPKNLAHLTAAEMVALRAEYSEYLLNQTKPGKDGTRRSEQEGEPDTRKHAEPVLMDYLFKQDMIKMNRVFAELREAVSGASLHGYSQLLGINSYDPAFIDDYSRTSVGWRSVLKKQLGGEGKELCSVNDPGAVADSEAVFTFTGFVRPGRHTIIVYDPSTETFHKRDLIVEPRKGEIPARLGALAVADQFQVLAEEYLDVLDHKKFVFSKLCLESDQKLEKLFKQEIKPEFLGELPNEFKYQVMDHIQDNYDIFYKVYQMCKMCALDDFQLPEQLQTLGVTIDWNFRKHGE